MLVAQLWLCAPKDFSPPGSSVHGILQPRILEWVAMPFSSGSSRLRNGIWVSCIAGRFFTIWVTKEAHEMRQTSINSWNLMNPKKVVVYPSVNSLRTGKIIWLFGGSSVPSVHHVQSKNPVNVGGVNLLLPIVRDRGHRGRSCHKRSFSVQGQWSAAEREQVFGAHSLAR